MMKEESFLVLGVMNTGSASLTFPEDFYFDMVFSDEKLAIARAIELNYKEGVPERILFELGLIQETLSDPSDDEDEEEEYEGVLYNVQPLKRG